MTSRRESLPGTTEARIKSAAALPTLDTDSAFSSSTGVYGARSLGRARRRPDSDYRCPDARGFSALDRGPSVAPGMGLHLLVAPAWIWLTNVVTMPLIYYLFLVTGRDLLGRWEKIRDLSTFNERFSGALDTGAGGLETLWVYTQRLVEQLGCPRCLAWLWSYASPHPASAPATRAATPGAGRVAAPGKRGDRRSHCLGDSPEMSPRQMTGILSAELRLRTGRRHLRCRWFSRRAGRQLPFTP